MRITLTILAGLLLSAASPVAYELERVVLGAGAADQTDGTYRVQGTFGEIASAGATDGTFQAGVGYWSLNTVAIYTGVPGGDAESPAPVPARALELFQNRPNPFNPTTEIPFSLPVAGRATLKLYDVTGREVATLVDRELPAGLHAVTLRADELASGVYFYRLNAGSRTFSKRMTLVK